MTTLDPGRWVRRNQDPEVVASQGGGGDDWGSRKIQADFQDAGGHQIPTSWRSAPFGTTSLGLGGKSPAKTSTVHGTRMH